MSDDTELAQCLALGLARGRPPIFPAEAVARYYADWYSTGPFDIGLATRNATSAAARAVAEGRPAAEAMWQAAAQVGTPACSCGSHFSSGAEAQRLLVHTAMQQMLKGA